MGRLLTAAKVVVPLVASWDSMPPNPPGSRQNLAGSGRWESVFQTSCQGGHLVAAFSERYLYGAKIEMGNRADFSVTSGVWGKADPICCPSIERVGHYVWDDERKLFGRTELRDQPRRSKH